MSTAAPPRSPADPSARPAVDWRIRFGVLSVIWGFSFLFIKLGTDGFAPMYVSFGRMFFGAVVLLVTLPATRQRLPRRGRTWAHLAVAAFLCNALPFTLFAYAELTISTTLAGICNATTPLWGMLLSLVALSEDRPTRRRFAGLGLGFIGVLVVLGAWQGFSGQDAEGTLLALIASLSYAVGWIYVRRTLSDTGDSHLAKSGSQLLLGAAQLAVVAPLVSPLPSSFPVVPLLAVFALGALGTGLAFLLQYALVAEVGPTTATMTTYFIPVVATTAGVSLLGEDLTWNTPVGALIVLAGAALTQSRGGGAGASRTAARSEDGQAAAAPEPTAAPEAEAARP
ncbi:DMT family transporter [Streptomyces triculaminicus]|uniref:DMT family transporter n=1 Tax=Streptomyces triculaminicus TaxID=2816232 RepID=A0A939JNP7_9ACTN|nr:DMT family transporter [Streptomyces triculaminicus]MBO0653668.1 DMT family transporter [Streptomyces triculaminicus]